MPQTPPHYVLYPITTLQPPFIVCYTALQASCVRPDPRNSYPGPKSPSRSPPDLPETPLLLIMQQELKANILLLAWGPLGFEGTPNISVSSETALEQFPQSSSHILPPETSSEQGRWPLQRTSFSLTRSIIFHILTLLAFLTVTHCYKPSLLHDCQSSCPPFKAILPPSTKSATPAGNLVTAFLFSSSSEHQSTPTFWIKKVHSNEIAKHLISVPWRPTVTPAQMKF